MRLVPLLCLIACPALANPLDGRSYIIEMSSSQMASGYAEYLLPPLLAVMGRSGLVPRNGPGADVVVNVVTGSDVGQWVDQAGEKVWLFTISVTVGISPEAYVIPYEGTPAFGVRADLMTPNPDREDELACLIGLAGRTALANYREGGGVLVTDGGACLRR